MQSEQIINRGENAIGATQMFLVNVGAKQGKMPRPEAVGESFCPAPMQSGRICRAKLVIGETFCPVFVIGVTFFAPIMLGPSPTAKRFRTKGFMRRKGKPYSLDLGNVFAWRQNGTFIFITGFVLLTIVRPWLEIIYNSIE